MPVSPSAKKALRTATRRHQENLIQRDAFKQAVKAVKKAVAAGSEGVAGLFSTAQSSLDRAAKNNTIHRNMAARIKSRLAKRVATEVPTPAPKKVTARKATTTKKKTVKA